MAHRDQVTHRIERGPSEMELMFALFQGGERSPDNRYTVVFHFVGEYVAQLPENEEAYSGVEVIINSLSWEDGSGQSFNFTGYPRALVKASGESLRLIGFGRQAEGGFSTKDRTGWINF